MSVISYKYTKFLNYIFILKKSKEMKQYKIIQVNEETHSLLQTYAKENGYTIKSLIHKLITEKNVNSIPIPNPKNALRVK
jgi:hypothetical protein